MGIAWVDPLIVLWTVLKWYGLFLVGLMCIATLADWWLDP